MTAWTEPPSLPDGAEAWARLANRLPRLAPLHLRAAALRQQPLADRQQPFLDLLAELDNLPMPNDMQRFARRVLATAGRAEAFLPND